MLIVFVLILRFFVKFLVIFFCKNFGERLVKFFNKLILLFNLLLIDFNWGIFFLIRFNFFWLLIIFELIAD